MTTDGESMTTYEQWKAVVERHGAAGDAGVVEQQVEPAESVFCFREKLTHGRGIVDVRRYDERLGIGLPYFKRGHFQGLLASAGKNHPVAVLSESDGEVLADPAACAGDDGDLRR